jgi:hypothetical protein
MVGSVLGWHCSTLIDHVSHEKVCVFANDLELAKHSQKTGQRLATPFPDI